MKNLALALFAVACLVVGSKSVTTNPASNVTADSQNTAGTIPLRDSSAQMEGLKFSTAFQPLVRTKAQIDVLVPAYGAGSILVCSDCTIAYSLCNATGTLAAQWARAGSSTVGCGTGN